MRKQDEVGAHHPGNRSACSNTGNSGVDVEEVMGHVCSQAANQVKQKITKVPQAVFDVVTKDCQKPHIHNQVQPRGVHKHGAEKWNNGGIRRQIAGDPRIHVLGHEPELENKGVAVARGQGKLEEEDEGVENDYKVVDIGCGGTWCVVTDGDHFLPMISFDYDAG
jgi:hypothetical protein